MFRIYIIYIHKNCTHTNSVVYTFHFVVKQSCHKLLLRIKCRFGTCFCSFLCCILAFFLLYYINYTFGKKSFQISCKCVYFYVNETKHNYYGFYTAIIQMDELDYTMHLKPILVIQLFQQVHH